MSSDRQPTEFRNAANQQRARILHRDLQRAEGTIVKTLLT